MLNHRIILLTFFLLLNSINAIVANDLKDHQISQYNIETLNTNDGLPAMGVLHIYQTSDNFIWFSTYNGLTQFNGKKVHVINQGNTEGLEVHSFKNMIEIDHTRWYGTQSGLVRYEEGQWSFFSHKEGLVGSDILALNKDKKGGLWVGTSKGLCFYDKKRNTVSTEGLPTELNQLPIVDLKLDRQGNLWVATSNKGIFVISPETKELIISYNQFEKVRTILLDQKGNTWVGGTGYLRVITSSGKMSDFVALDKLPSRNITYLYEDSKDAIWIGTDNGVARFYKGKISSFTGNKEISSHIVCNILEDNEGNYWVGTYRHGVYKLNNGQFISYSTENGITGKLVYSITKGLDKLLLATDNGVTVYKDEKFSPYPFNNQLRSKTIKDVFIDTKQNTWIATKKGLTKIDTRGVVKHYSESNGLSNNYARFTFEDSYGNIWVGTINGLNILHKNGDFQTFSTKDGLGSDYILSMYQDSDHRIWICTKSGITIYEKGHFTDFTKKYQLKPEIVFKVMEDSKKRIWFGTNNGIYRFQEGKVFSYHKKIDSDITSAFSIFEDLVNDLFWVASNDGVYTIKIKDLEAIYNDKLEKAHIKIYDKNDGMRSKSIIANGRSIALGNGEIWYQSDDGVSIVNTRKIIKNEVAPSVFVDNVIVNSVPVTNLNDEIVIDEGNSRLEISYEAISFLDPEGTTFKYQLKGFDKTWIYTSDDLKAVYTNLPPGEYKFLVSASNQDGVWSDTPVELRFKKMATFYERPEIQLVFILLFALALFIIYRWRVKSYKIREMRLERKVSERTKEILEKSEALQKQSEELQQQSEELQQQSEELQQQRDYLSETNDTISKRNDELHFKNFEISQLIDQVQSINEDMKSKNTRLTDSIRYAKTMQFALLPNDEKLKNSFDQHFIIFKPKDIVSGDFYWMFRTEDNTTFIASVDCTGHGVPGGFMSMLGISILNKIIREQKEHDTTVILSRLNTSIINYLQQEDSRIDDGMDISLCKIEPQPSDQYKITFSGAKSTVYFYKKDTKQLFPCKGDNISIGNRKKKKEFTAHTINLMKGDSIYLSTDGYIDQNNHSRKKIGKKLFEEVLVGIASLDMDKQKEQLEQLLKIHQKEETQRDDITVIGLKL